MTRTSEQRADANRWVIYICPECGDVLRPHVGNPGRCWLHGGIYGERVEVVRAEAVERLASFVEETVPGATVYPDVGMVVT